MRRPTISPLVANAATPDKWMVGSLDTADLVKFARTGVYLPTACNVQAHRAIQIMDSYSTDARRPRYILLLTCAIPFIHDVIIEVLENEGASRASMNARMVQHRDQFR